MNLFVKINSDNVGYANLRDILETPYVFDVEVFDCVDIAYSEIGDCNKNNIDILNSIVQFDVTEENFYSVLDFVEECEYLVIKEILKDNVVTEYMSENLDLLKDKFGLENESLYFTDGDFYIDSKLDKAYKIRNDKLVFIGKVKELLMKCELEWFDTIYIRNINDKLLLKRFELDLKHNTKKEIIKQIEYKMEKELLDLGETNQNIMSKIDDDVYNFYLRNFCTAENYKEFFKKQEGDKNGKIYTSCR